TRTAWRSSRSTSRTCWSFGEAGVHLKVEGILEHLDRRKGQVLIEVAIVQVTGDSALDLGIEGLSLNNGPGQRQFDGGTGFGIGTQADAATGTAAAPTTT